MSNTPSFITQRAEELCSLHAIKNVLFSHGTYQVQIVDPETKEEYWPFIQIDDEGELLDTFCSCVKGQECEHLGAAYITITPQGLPLHVRFKESFWNALGLIGAKRHGYDEGVLSEDEDGLYIESNSGRRLFALKSLRRRGEQFLDEFIRQRVEETEETSIKFSNLPLDELELWRKGTPSHALQYDLSFWSDIAKFLFLRQHFGENYSLEFKKEDERFKVAHVVSSDLDLSIYIAESNWNSLIPTLATIASPYKYHEMVNVAFDRILYDEKTGQFRLHVIRKNAAVPKQESEYGKFVYVEGVGFFPQKNDPLLSKQIIEPRFVPTFLDRYRLLIEQYCHNTRIHPGKHEPKFSLYFDEKDTLHIDMYLFEEGDLQTTYARKYANWVYIEEKGFYALETAVFSDISTTIPKEKIPEFIPIHRSFLNEYPGFETHLSNVETRIVYSVDRKKNLHFSSETSFLGESEEIIDLGSWIYMPSKGFYSKQLGRSHAFLSAGHVVSKKEVPNFIDAHKEDLETVRGFFSATCPIAKSGVEISLNKKDEIEILPRLSFYPNYKKSQVALMGKYTYVEGEGFFEIPAPLRVPSKYAAKQTVDSSAEAFFVTCELAKLKPHILSLDKRLTTPAKLQLKIKKIEKKNKQWVLDLYYESELGKISLEELVDAFHTSKGYIKSKAGLIFFKDTRFNWLHDLDETSFLENGNVRLRTLDWMRLTITENMRPPMGRTEEAQASNKLFKELKEMVTHSKPDLTHLKSALRPYQIVGVQWLWFLYMNGLSGLLCDEMGLGKTHQAMALLAAAHAENEKNKFLVVCPTSVIYHWEDLLADFFPKLRVLVYYGTTRSLKGFKKEYDLVLTSYGTLRNEKSELEKTLFDVAVFDEVQVAKNHLSQTHKTLRRLRANMRLGLTGTPIENKLIELKALFDVVVPTYFPSHAQFRDLFVVPIEKNNDAIKKKLLGKMIQPFLLRRKKTEVLKDLPEKIEEVSHCMLSDEQKMLYKQIVLRDEEKVREEMEKGDSLHIFSLLTKLKKVCNHPALLSGSIREYHKHSSGKWDLFIELMQEIRESGQKVVIFSQYLEMLDIIERYLEDSQIEFAGIRGSTRDRKTELKRFKEDPQCKVFVASLKAVGVGVDLVSASVVIHYDRWWNPAVEDQATDRVHRIGQKRGVQVFKLVTRNTVEEHIDQLIRKKIDLMRGVLGYDEETHLKRFSHQDLEALMQMIHEDISS